MTDEQIIILAQKNGFLGPLDVILDRDVAIQFARLVIQEYEKLQGGTI